VVAAFDPSIDARPGVREAVAAAAERGPVGLVSNCVVPELVGRTLVRAGLREAIDVVVTSAGCGWRKPDPRPFEALARRADRTLADLVHVGGDPRTDAGVVAAGGRYVHVVDPTDEAAPPDPPRGGSVPTDLRLAGLSGLAEEADESTAAHDEPRAGSVDGDDPTTCVSLPALAAALRAEAPPWS
jgi:FMN phosphatase YigB (HAD superfamily)